MMGRCKPRPRRHPGTLILVSLCVCMDVLSLLTGCVSEPHYVSYSARLLPANEPDQPRQDERVIETKEDTASPRDQEAPWEPQLWSCVYPCFQAVPPIASQPSAVEHVQPYDYERAMDAQEQGYRQQRNVQEQEQVRREQQWEEERLRRNDPRLER